jgi:hypothetical protein
VVSQSARGLASLDWFIVLAGFLSLGRRTN